MPKIKTIKINCKLIIANSYQMSEPKEREIRMSQFRVIYWHALRLMRLVRVTFMITNYTYDLNVFYI